MKYIAILALAVAVPSCRTLSASGAASIAGACAKAEVPAFESQIETTLLTEPESTYVAKAEGYGVTDGIEMVDCALAGIATAALGADGGQIILPSGTAITPSQAAQVAVRSLAIIAKHLRSKV